MTLSMTDAEFSEAVFPIEISVGSTATSTFSTDIEMMENGFERRSSNWSQSRHSYDVSTGISTHALMSEAKAWFMRAGGRLLPFRFRDPQDWSSAADGDSDPTPTDQLIGIGDGSRRKFGLVKNYLGFSREIFKPIQGSVRCAINGVETSSFTVDYTTGVVTFSSSPSSGASVSAGFFFDVPVRFDSDDFTATWSDVNLLTGSIPLTEIRLKRSIAE